MKMEQVQKYLEQFRRFLEILNEGNGVEVMTYFGEGFFHPETLQCDPPVIFSNALVVNRAAHGQWVGKVMKVLSSINETGKQIIIKTNEEVFKPFYGWVHGYVYSPCV